VIVAFLDDLDEAKVVAVAKAEAGQVVPSRSAGGIGLTQVALASSKSMTNHNVSSEAMAGG
jgi:hypothetical protein